MASVVTKSSLPEEGVGIEGNESPINFPGADELKAIASNILDEGLEAFGKGMHFAAEMGMQTSHLSEMRRSRRIVPFPVVLRLMSNRAAAEIVIGRQCSLAGFPSPLLTTVSLTTQEAKALDAVRSRMRAAGLWTYFGADLAAGEYRCALDLLDNAIDLSLRHLRTEER